MIKPDGIPEVIEHNNWIIWGWTGWKGTKSKVLASWMESCTICGIPFEEGVPIELVQSRRPRHWLCVHPDNAPDRLMGQWLAVKGEEPNVRYMEVNVDNIVAGFISGGEYKRGESFPVSIEGEFITEHTPDAVREVARQIGLQRLKYLIDQAEACEVSGE